MQNLTEVLMHYGVQGKVVRENSGPLVKLVEFLPQPGTKIRNITRSQEDIARELGISSLRVEALEENGTIGFEFPADEMKIIDFKNILQSPQFLDTKAVLPLIMGVDIKGTPVIADLAKMPHLLIGGTTGSGKSVGLNTFILSLIAKMKPADLKLVLIDPKRIEFSVYNNQKYLLAPVVTETAEASATLEYLVGEMETRYALFEENLVKNILEYNNNVGHMPYIVCIIDEFADLMSVDKKVEASVQRLAQKARAAGIHLILATQRPSVDVVTGVLKANFPTRLSYKVASAADSRTILDSGGAEKLVGRGDALFVSANGDLKRIHGAFMPDNDIAAMLNPFRSEVKPLPIKKADVIVGSKSIGKSKSFLHMLWDFWTSLRKRDRKAVVDGVKSLFNLFNGFKKRR